MTQGDCKLANDDDDDGDDDSDGDDDDDDDDDSGDEGDYDDYGCDDDPVSKLFVLGCSRVAKLFGVLIKRPKVVISLNELPLA